MKKYNGFIMIAASIVIAAIIISIPIYNKSISSLDHCYKKVYKSELKNSPEYYSKEQSESRAARKARRQCTRN